MITVIAEYVALVSAKARMAPARQAIQFQPARIIGAAQGVLETTDRALVDAHSTLTTAIDNLLPDNIGTPDAVTHQMLARHAFTAIATHAGIIAELDLMLTAAAVLPADVDVDHDVVRLRTDRETALTELTRNTAVLVVALAESRSDVGPTEEGTSA